jgi:hypothetical protein
MRIAFVLGLILLALAGCSGPTEEPQAQADKDAITVTTPDATAEDHQKGLANADMSPEVKKVLGGAGR